MDDVVDASPDRERHHHGLRERPSPPHFHAIAPDFEALIEIATLSVRAGSLGRSRRAVLDWAAENVAVIKAEWNRINPRFPVK